MKIRFKSFFLLLFLLLYNFIKAEGTLDVYLNIKRYFDINTEKSYVELQYLIPGNVLSYVGADDGPYKAQVLMAVHIKNNQGEVVFSNNYVLNSPSYSYNELNVQNLTDVLHIPIANDSITVIIQAVDVYNQNKVYSDVFDIIPLKKSEAFLSDVSLINEVREGSSDNLFFKAGHVLVPKFLNYYPTEVSKLQFYIETYTNSNTAYVMRFYLSDENNVVLEKYANFKKKNNETFDALLSGFDISTLPSGNYYVYVELRDKENNLMDRKRMFFQRNNQNELEKDNTNYYELKVMKDNFAKKYDERNLIHHLKAIKPICQDFQSASIESALNSNDLDYMQKTFFNFWVQLDAKTPELAWQKYAKEVQYADAEFGTSIMEGIETSRGFIYLKYGKPQERIERNTKQYGRIEIWNYEQIDKQGNVQFLFLETPNYDDEFQLVHSNLNGEIFSKEWDKILKNNNF